VTISVGQPVGVWNYFTDEERKRVKETQFTDGSNRYFDGEDNWCPLGLAMLNDSTVPEPIEVADWLLRQGRIEPSQHRLAMLEAKAFINRFDSGDIDPISILPLYVGLTSE
jgi:hypothetical protein